MLITHELEWNSTRGKAEGLMQKVLYPYPTYEELIYAHHS